MTTETVLLLGYVLLLAAAGPRLLTTASWADRAPRLGIAAWQAITASAVVATVLAGLSVTLPAVHLGFDLSGLLHACLAALRAQYQTPAGIAAGSLGAAIALAVASRAAACVTKSLLHARRTRHRHLDALRLLGEFDPALDAVVVPWQQPAVYCLPGRPHCVVVTSAALGTLSGEQMAAALAHEHGHVRQRHHLVTAWASGLARAFPRIELFRTAEQETARLVEMLADDHALRGHDRLVLAEALVLLSSPAPPAALAAGGVVTARVHRLITPRPPLTARHRTLAIAALLLVGLAPLIPVSDASQSPGAGCRPPTTKTAARSAPTTSQPPAHSSAPGAAYYAT